MLGDQKLVAFVPVRNADTARAFYRDKLGLHLLYEDGFALAFEVAGIMLRATLIRDFQPQKFTVLGWQVPNADAFARQMIAAGIQMERYPGLQQDELGVWTAPGGAKIAWFLDPDGNILSISQHP
ncbi:MAG TPA: VOC family protein [Acidobacteriaceae bacterium]|nr:VOC family protein [Acidobacteriaceae bacterium]